MIDNVIEHANKKSNKNVGIGNNNIAIIINTNMENNN